MAGFFLQLCNAQQSSKYKVMSVTHFLIIYNSNNSRYAVSFKVQCIMLPIYLGMYIDRPLLGFIKELKDRIDFKIYDRQMEK